MAGSAASVPASGIGAGTANISITGNAATATNALNFTGAVADAQLSANIARLNGTNLFTGTNTFANNVIVEGANLVILNSQNLTLGVNNVANGGGGSVAMGFRTTANGAYAFAGGYGNIATGIGSVVVGGGNDGFGGQPNTNSGNAAFIGGGINNSIPSGADYSFIGGGLGNNVSGYYATVGGGQENYAVAADATVAGGGGAIVTGEGATVGGGDGNHATAELATVAGGAYNTASGVGSFVGGGGYDGYTDSGNANSGNAAVIGGGLGNLVTGNYATIPGGGDNVAEGTGSFVAGINASDVFNSVVCGNSFVWGDGSRQASAQGPNTFNILATNGVWIFDGPFPAGVKLAAGSSSWAAICDRNAKKNFAAVNGEEILNALASIPIEKWNYKWENDSDVPNIGPMAQDFKHAFYPGRDDKSITTLEFDGVELAAIQGLNQKLEEQKAENATKTAEIDQLKQQLAELKTMVQKLAQQK